MVLRFWLIIEVKHRLEIQPEILNAEHESPTSTTTTTILLVVNFWAKVAPRIAELRLLASFMKNKIQSSGFKMAQNVLCQVMPDETSEQDKVEELAGYNQQGFERFSNVWATCLSVHF